MLESGHLNNRRQHELQEYSGGRGLGDVAEEPCYGPQRYSLRPSPFNRCHGRTLSKAKLTQ
jgi:hypothetical protein